MTDVAPHEPTTTHRMGPPWLAVAVLVTVPVALVAIAVGSRTLSYDIWGALWVGPVLIALVIPFARRIARIENNPGLFGFLMGAAVLKIIGGSLVRYWMAVDLYGGAADSSRYHEWGEHLAPAIRSLDYPDFGKISGTRFIDVLTGHVYAVIWPTKLGGFMVFSAMAFAGLLFFYRAFCIGVPDGDHRRYRVLVFLLPSMAFWPSSIGKEAWMVFCLGVAAWGAVHLLHGKLIGGAPAALAVWGMAVVRPHVGLLAVLALAVGILVALVRGRTSRSKRHPLTLLGVAAITIVATVSVVGRLETFFKLDGLDVESAESVFSETTRRTAQGGSEFSAPDASTPHGYLAAAFTVLVRPLPGEASGVQGQFAAAEGLLVLAIIVVSVRGLAQLPRAIRRHPLLAASVIFVAAYIYAFSSVENFGILARQRVQVLPFLFVVMCATRPRPAIRASTP